MSGVAFDPDARAEFLAAVEYYAAFFNPIYYWPISSDKVDSQSFTTNSWGDRFASHSLNLAEKESNH